NRICFGPGALTGTLAPAHSRMKITSISPNGFLQNAGIGGHFPLELRKAGYDNLTIQGKSEKAVYLYIHDEGVEIKDATDIWGKDTQETQRALKEELGQWVKVACIGPAGENLVSFSSIHTGEGSAAARGGFGAIMGSKNLKAIVVRGTGQIKIAQPSKFISACKDTQARLMNDQGFMMQSKDGHGDKFLLDFTYASGLGLTGSWEDGKSTWEAEFGDVETFYESYTDHQYGCSGCPVHHWHVFDIPGRCRGATKCSHWYDFSGPLHINDRNVIVHASTLCDYYGLDSSSTSNSISLLMELYHKGIITEKDTDGIAMRYGDEKAIITAIEKIAKQEGFGKLFRNGAWGFAKEIGKEAEGYAIVVNNQEVQPGEVRAFKSFALAAAVTDGTARYGGWIAEFFWEFEKERAEEMAQEISGDIETACPTSYEKKALGVWDYENRNTAVDLTGTCSWVIPVGVTHKLEIPAKLYSLATGRDTSEEELLRAAQRVLMLERAFMASQGIRRDTLPKKLFETAVPSGPFKGERLDREKFEKMLDEYYEVRGWNSHGIPTEKSFNKFDLMPEWKAFKKYLGKEDRSNG
ncbi:MAG: hypothetical protein JRH15_23565, partial [Deltaproteobacteria bacterium]|nr:hypothetical protein [Deltaproteobacteria bacterium]